jgi:1,4-alpha-glucan branching enzyme
MIRKSPSSLPNHVHVVFELPSSLWADRVYLVADFNDWNPSATPLRQQRDGIWRTAVDLPAERRYEFRYLIDGYWCTDYHADSRGDNTLNSVVETTPPAERYVALRQQYER